MSAAAVFAAILQILSTGTVFFTQLAELMPRLQAMVPKGALTEAQKAELDAALDRWAEQNRQLSATIQSFRNPA